MPTAEKNVQTEARSVAGSPETPGAAESGAPRADPDAPLDSSTMQRIADRIFFVVGCGRSGTSLLTAMISAHPELLAVNETQFWPVVYRKNRRRLGRLSGPPFVDAVVKAIQRCWWIREEQLDERRLRELAVAAGGRWPDVFLALLALWSERSGARRVGDKSPGNLNHVDLLARTFPSSQFIHIIRDPRAVFSSFRKVPFGPKRVAHFADQWNFSVEQHERCTRELPAARYHQLRYEDLVTRPQEELRRICSFLGVDWTADMLAFHRRKDAGFSGHKKAHMANTFQPISTDKLNGWQESLDSTRIALVEHACRANMEKMGYRPLGNGTPFAGMRLAGSRLAGVVQRPHAAVRARIRARRIHAELDSRSSRASA